MPCHAGACRKVCQLWAVAAAALNLTEGLLGHAQLPAYVACERLQQLGHIYQGTLLSLRASVLHVHRCEGVHHQYHGLRQRSRYMYYIQSTHALGRKMSYQEIILCNNFQLMSCLLAKVAIVLHW
jgi:hypothetical protein